MNWALLKNGGLATFGVLVQGLARFLYTIFVGRALGAEDLGQVSSLLALAVFVSLFWPTAAGVAASRFMPRDAHSGRVPSPSLAAITRHFLVSLPVLSLGTFIIAMVMTADVWAALAAVALTVSYSGYMFTRGAALGAGKFVRIATLDLVSSSSALLLLALVLVGGWHWAVLLPLTLGYLVFAVLNWPGSVASGPETKREVSRFVLQNSIAQVATGGLLQVAMLAAALFDNPYQAGLFAAALSLATPAAMLGQSLNQVLIPHFADMSVRASGSITMSTIRITLVVVGGLGLVFGTLVFLAPFVLNVLYGPQYVPASGYMRALLVGVYIYAASLVPAATLIATGRDRRFTVASVCGFVVGISAMIFLGSGHGAWSAVWGYFLGTVVSAVLTIVWGTGKIASERSSPLGRK